MVPLASALAVGAVIGDAFGPHLVAYAVLCLAAVGLGLWAKKSLAAATALLMGVLLFGAFLQAVRQRPGEDGLDDRLNTEGLYVSGAILEQRLLTPHRDLYAMRVDAVASASSQWRSARARALMELPGSCGDLLPRTRVVLRDCVVSRPLRVTNWHQRDRTRALARQGIRAAIKAGGIEDAEPARGWEGVVGAVLSLRPRLLLRLEAAMPGGTAEARQGRTALLASMVFGETASPVHHDTRELFRKTGTIHLLVVSGAQVSIVMAFVVTLLGARRRLMWWHVCIMAPLLVFFGLFVGMGPSIARSLVMAGLWLVCMWTGRRYDVASSLAAAAAILVLSDPSTVFDAGTQLTFAATTGVILFLPPARRADTGELVPHHGVKSAALGTLGAWVFVTPILMHYFYNFAITGSLANIVAVPLSGLIVVLGLIAAPLAFLVPAVCTVICGIEALLMAVVCAVNRLCDLLPLSFVDRVYLSAPGCVLWMGLALVGIAATRNGFLARMWTKHRPALVTWACAVGAIVALVFALREALPRPWSITTFDVGEGQCTLIETPQRQTILADAGGRWKWSSYEIATDILLPYLVQRGHRRIDLLVISHPDGDHYGAAAELVRRMPMRVALVNGSEGEQSYQRFLERLIQTGTRVEAVADGSAVRVGRAYVEVLSPPGDARLINFPGRDNDRSLVLRVLMGRYTALLPGDLETAGMRWVLENNGAQSVRADFLQIPHHGRSSADLPRFFEAVAPRVAVASRFGDPVIRTAYDTCLETADSVYSTEDCGAVRVLFRERLSTQTYLRCGGGA